ncbi:hypothetical protein FZI91_16530 [Mycobacterium sp. CBMA271]|uniref:hypothetical protein n=1 Tax=unclassified Mycobacteroides TaxID=2618759 RepID=UPI0012DDD4F6|nr:MULTISPECIES: hypothetical protein [unclassified Mycobacteroides]MUM17058.1 hypothetical protein [Mycobacteroides sp. CBMA 326]MUM23296.1 hypothetical protein [Mycobacteroides sp. CBMA 271]
MRNFGRKQVLAISAAFVVVLAVVGIITWNSSHSSISQNPVGTFASASPQQFPARDSTTSLSIAASTTTTTTTAPPPAPKACTYPPDYKFPKPTIPTRIPNPDDPIGAYVGMAKFRVESTQTDCAVIGSVWGRPKSMTGVPRSLPWEEEFPMGQGDHNEVFAEFGDTVVLTCTISLKGRVVATQTGVRPRCEYTYSG